MSLADRLVAAANGDVSWRKALLLEAAIAIEAQRAVTTEIGTVRSTKARAEGIAKNTPHPIQPRERK